MRRLGMVVALGLLALPAPVFARSTSVERGLLRRINGARAGHHLPALRFRDALRSIAVAHTSYMVRIHELRHASADGTTADLRIRRALRVSSTGETLALAMTASALFRLWMDSPPHRAILLDRHLKYIGLDRKSVV